MDHSPKYFSYLTIRESFHNYYCNHNTTSPIFIPADFHSCRRFRHRYHVLIMAYAAVTSLYHTIDLLLSSSRTSIDPSSLISLKNARWVAERLQGRLRKYDDIKNSSEEVLAMDALIRDEARKLEDAIETEASAQFLSQCQSQGRFLLSLYHLRNNVSRFLRKTEAMGAEYMKKLYRPASVAAAAAPIPFSSDGGVMVGFADLYREIRDVTVQAGHYRTVHLKAIAVTGMAGIGKTTLVNKIFHDPLVIQTYKDRAFVRVGQKYEFEQILRSIIAQLNIDSHNKMIMGGNENIFQYFTRCLVDRQILIVVDDAWDNVSSGGYNLLGLVPKTCNVLFLMTSRIEGIKRYRCSYKMRFLNKVESWELLQRKVFGEDQDCPGRLVKAGKKIAENCEGLPLLILSIAHLLIKAPKEVAYWEEVAKMRNSVFEDAMDQIYEVLLPSYHYLSQRSKACFLYMCVFPRDYLVLRSKVNNLWLAEGFADGVSFVLDDIVSSNLVVTHHQNWSLTKTKACSLHIVNRHLSRRVAEDNKFIFVLKTNVVDGQMMERIKDKPHLAIYNNSLLAMKEVDSSIARISALRSMLCTGPYHPYQVPVCMELTLLRVLDAVTIRFYEFPVEVVKLIQLRYLSLSTNANLPPSINRLWFLEYLIVHQHMSIINRRSTRSIAESCSYVPKEIWELEQLKYLQLVGRNLPPPPLGEILSNLTTLLDVGAQSCVAGVLESIPKLEKLRIRIESEPEHATTMPSFDHFCLEKLKSLGGIVFSPKLLCRPAFPPRLRISSLMTSLEKLSLSGFGYPWEDMSEVAKLSCLKVLKLQCYAFRGQEWAPSSAMRFKDLRYLLIEDTDLVKWTVADETFPKLTRLSMRNCHKLHAFPLIKTLTNIQLLDCKPSVKARGPKIANCYIKIVCSWK